MCVYICVCIYIYIYIYHFEASAMAVLSFGRMRSMRERAAGMENKIIHEAV